LQLVVFTAIYFLAYILLLSSCAPQSAEINQPGIKMKNQIKATVKFAAISLLALAATFSGAATAAAMLGQAPDTSLIVTAGGYEWVYAGPCAGQNPSCGTVQLHHDFAFATDEQWNASFTSLAELFSAFAPGGNVLCASSYFNTVYDHCDASDITSGYVWHSPLAPSLGQRDALWGETFLVRSVDAPADVPEPASLALFGLGLAGAAAARRKFSK
jgi:hypothetical protein